jgi:hypothetical protein
VVVEMSLPIRVVVPFDEAEVSTPWVRTRSKRDQKRMVGVYGLCE